MRNVKVKSNHVALDVTHGRKTIFKHLTKGGTCDVTIKGKILDEHLVSDDGVSIEFLVIPENVQVVLEEE